MKAPVVIDAIAFEPAASRRTVEGLDADGLLQSPAAVLREAGFAACHVADVPASTLAERAVRRVLDARALAPGRVKLIVTASAVPTSAIVPPDGAHSVLERMPGALELTRFTGPRLQHRLGLANARTLGVTELGCVALQQAVWLAHRLMDAEDWDSAICVNADVVPRGVAREELGSVMSDAGCAVLLTREAGGHRLLRHAHVTRGAYWDAEARPDDLLAAYYPIARRLVHDTLAAAGLAIDDVACLLPNNVSLRSWQVLSRAIGLPLARVHTDNIAAHGHAMASDPFINLHDALRAGRLRAGDIVVLFGFGLGAHWACTLVQIGSTTT